MREKKNPFEKELAAFEKDKEKLLAEHEGKYALVKEDKVVGVFESENDAISQGYERFGTQLFLVKHISEKDESMNFLSFNLAV